MRVLHLISSGGMYGAEAVILNLSHALERTGDTSVIASLSNASLQLHERALAEGLTSCLLECQGQVSPRTLPAVRDAVKRYEIDLVHAHGYKADLYAWAALRGSRVPLVSTCHTWYDNDLALRFYGWLDRRVLRGYARVVAVSAEVEGQLLRSGVAAARIRRIRNGIDLERYRAIAAERTLCAEGHVRVGLVGRLAREKGVDVFIDAAGMVAKAMPNVEFVVVGEGPDRAQLESQVRSLGLEGKLRFAGHRSDMPQVYAEMDLLVSASRQEGLPVALLEGMASGLPLVGTTVGELPAIVVQGETGVLVPPEQPAALANAMLQVLQDDALRVTWGANARARVEREFSADRMVAEYREVYREATREGGRP